MAEGEQAKRMMWVKRMKSDYPLEWTTLLEAWGFAEELAVGATPEVKKGQLQELHMGEAVRLESQD